MVEAVLSFRVMVVVVMKFETNVIKEQLLMVTIAVMMVGGIHGGIDDGGR